MTTASSALDNSIRIKNKAIRIPFESRKGSRPIGQVTATRADQSLLFVVKLVYKECVIVIVVVVVVVVVVL